MAISYTIRVTEPTTKLTMRLVNIERSISMETPIGTKKLTNAKGLRDGNKPIVIYHNY